MPTVDVKTSVQFCKQKIIKTAITIIMYMEWLLALGQWDSYSSQWPVHCSSKSQRLLQLL